MFPFKYQKCFPMTLYIYNKHMLNNSLIKIQNPVFQLIHFKFNLKGHILFSF